MILFNYSLKTTIMLKVWFLIKLVYKTILRDLVVGAIDDPNSEVDDFVLKLLDNLFEHGNE